LRPFAVELLSKRLKKEKLIIILIKHKDPENCTVALVSLGYMGSEEMIIEEKNCECSGLIEFNYCTVNT
jgi:hypothetical protein